MSAQANACPRCQQLLALLQRCRYFVEADVQMCSAITRHNPLPDAEQAAFDNQESTSEILLKELDTVLPPQ